MPESDLSGYNGSVTLPTTHGGQARGFTVRRAMATKNTGRYAAGSRFAQMRGGTITVSGDINVFLRKSAANTGPGIVTPVADGSALTLTLETGCSLAGTAIFQDFNSTHAFDDPAIEGTYGYTFTGTVTETWATS